MNIFVSTILWIAYVIALYFSIFIFLVYLDKKKIFDTEKSSVEIANEPLVSILIPAYNEEKTIVKTLQSVNDLDYPKEKMEVIVINDGSKDNTEINVKEYIKDKPHFKLMSQQNKGKAAAMNEALKIAQGEFFACLDADSFVSPLTLKKMLALYYKENDSHLAIITPAMKVYQPKNILQKIQWLEYIVIILISRITSHLDSLYVAPGPFSLYKTNIIQKLGGFDEKNITEDQEIAYRAQKHDYRIKQCFDGYVYTTAPQKIRPFYQQRRRWYLGSISCIYKYKKMVANKRYGDFGMIQMIKNVAGYILAITGITIALYVFLVPFLTNLKNLFLIKFNIIPYLLSYKIKFTIINLLLTDFKIAILVVSLFVIGIFLFRQAHHNAGEKITKFGLLHLIPYFAFYYLLKGIILLMSLIEFTRNKKLKW